MDVNRNLLSRDPRKPTGNQYGKSRLGQGQAHSMWVRILTQQIRDCMRNKFASYFLVRKNPVQQSPLPCARPSPCGSPPSPRVKPPHFTRSLSSSLADCCRVYGCRVGGVPQCDVAHRAVRRYQHYASAGHAIRRGDDGRWDGLHARRSAPLARSEHGVPVGHVLGMPHDGRPAACQQVHGMSVCARSSLHALLGPFAFFPRSLPPSIRAVLKKPDYFFGYSEL